MEQSTEQIFNNIRDYRNQDGLQLTKQNIADWANQFGEDASVVLNELAHILPKAYFSKARARETIKQLSRKLGGVFRCTSLSNFLEDTLFFDMQAPGKSQGALLALLEDVLQQDYDGQSYRQYANHPKKNFVYFDDVLATGGTVGKDLIDWLKQTQAGSTKTNFEKVMEEEYRLAVAFLCIHTWGLSLLKQRLNYTFHTNKLSERIVWLCEYKVENHLQKTGQKLNTVIPVFTNNQSRAYLYLQGLQQNIRAHKFPNYAYRNPYYPTNESFFTTPDNRTQYENLLLEKGLDIIDMIQGEVRPNIRPLGFIYPDYLTFGLGTHFFSWRKVPNNCPLVFWWEVAGHNWKPLFPVTRTY